MFIKISKGQQHFAPLMYDPFCTLHPNVQNLAKCSLMYHFCRILPPPSLCPLKTNENWCTCHSCVFLRAFSSFYIIFIFLPHLLPHFCNLRPPTTSPPASRRRHRLLWPPRPTISVHHATISDQTTNLHKTKIGFFNSIKLFFKSKKKKKKTHVYTHIYIHIYIYVVLGQQTSSVFASFPILVKTITKNHNFAIKEWLSFSYINAHTWFYT